MKTLHHRLAALLCSALVAAAFTACANPEEDAAKLLTRAGDEVAAAQKAEATSYVEAAAQYQKAVDDLKEIRAKFPGTKAAAGLAAAGAKVGPFAVADLEAIVLPQSKRKAEAEASPVGAAEYLANTITDNYERASALCLVSRTLTATGKAGVTAPMLEDALTASKGITGAIHGPEEGYAMVADAYIENKDFVKAEALIDGYNLADERAQLAVGLAKAGQTGKALAMIDKLPAAEPGPRVKALGDVACALAAQGKRKEALPLMERARKLASGAPDHDESIKLQADLEEKLAAAKVMDRSATMLDDPAALRNADWAAIDAILDAHRTDTKGPKLLERVHADLAALERPETLVDLPEVEHERWLTNLAYLQAKLGESGKSLFTLAKAKEIPDQMAAAEQGMEAYPANNAKYSRADVLLHIGQCNLKLGQLQEGGTRLDTLLDLLRGAQPYPSDWNDKKADLIGEAALAWALSGDSDKGVRTAATIANKEYACNTLAKLEAPFQAALAKKEPLDKTLAALHDLVAKN